MSRSVLFLARLAGRSQVLARCSSSSISSLDPLCHPVPAAATWVSGIVRNCPSPLQVWGTWIPARGMRDEHTAKWMQSSDRKSPMELISEVPPIEVDAGVAACEGGRDPALGHPVEYISLDDVGPSVCKYCGLRYVQRHGHHGGHH